MVFSSAITPLSPSPVTVTFAHHITEHASTSTPVSSSAVLSASALHASSDSNLHRKLQKYVS